MHIKSIILDGFKSYGSRTEINDFDPEFNAITGLNGSGKSNILDSICFVLGISNLSHVRAGSFQDLIYKNGQAGITKATVTIKFDNSVKAKSPIGYENKDEIIITRQTIIGGKNKYMINGALVTAGKVSDLFCSIQLNVNNPNFLIMQGRITKVLNMKPLEILSLIEEAAGTSMYEAKRDNAKKTLDKKQSKLDNFNQILRDEFKPRLDRLKSERDQYHTFNKLVRELEILNRRYIACQYVYCKKERDAADSVQQRSVKVIEDCQQKLIHNKKESLQIDSTIATLQEKISAEAGGHLAELDSDLKEKSKKKAKLFAAYKSSNETIEAEEARLQNLVTSLEIDQKMFLTKKKKSEEADTVFLTLKETYEKDAAAVTTAQQQLQAASAGMSADDKGQSATLQDQLIAAEQTIASAKTEKKSAEMELNYCTSQLKEKKRELTSSDADYKKTKKTYDHTKKELLHRQSELDTLSFSEENMSELEEKQRVLNEKCRNLRDCGDRFANTHPFCSFTYTDPEPNFNRSRVKGVVCKLFSAKSEVYMTALETCAGGRLYDVVVDTEVTAKKVLEKGNLKSRRTLIPLNKISGRVADNRTIESALRVGGGKDNVQLALHQIEYDNEISSAMAYIFGQTFLCKNMDVARKVAFDPNVKRRCVTLDGDVVDPAGTLSGGSRTKSGSLLLKIQNLNRDLKELPKAERELAAINIELRKMRDISASYKVKMNDLGLLKLQFDGLQRSLQQNPYHLQQEEIAKLEEEIAKLQESVNSCENLVIESSKRADELRSKLKDSKGYREREIKNAEVNLKTCQKNALTSQEKWKEREQEFESMKLEIIDLTKSIDTGKQQIDSLKETIIQLKEDSKGLFSDFDNIKQQVEEIENLVKSQKAEITKQNKEIQTLVDKKHELNKQNGELELEIKKEEQDLTKLKNSAEDNKKKCAELLKTNTWIAAEEENFNKPGSCFDIRSIDVKDLANTITSKTEQKKALERTVNERAMKLLGQEEALLVNVEKKKAKVEKDKDTLVKLIKNLDKKKKDILIEAWKQVNKDFGSIFTTLLPGASAKLEPPSGKAVVDGVEIKVGFNNVWKESLNELSGGQRSLVALSLILAMLLFNPAPLYILDEIDAALDLSHTQNIGQMLKTHFKSSQFIIVSLKEGMFNNANVLFETKFVNGLSTVRRTVQSNK